MTIDTRCDHGVGFPANCLMCDLIHKAMVDEGWLIPTTVEEVLAEELRQEREKDAK